MHGATVPSGETFEVINPHKGGGDFGAGFYTFKLCGEDHKAAIETAKKRAKNKRSEKRSPKGYGRISRSYNIGSDSCLVFCRIPKTHFEQLTSCNDSEYGYRQNDRYYSTNCDVISGFMQWGGGQHCYFDLPHQYKFENKGITALEVIGREHNLE